MFGKKMNPLRTFLALALSILAVGCAAVNSMRSEESLRASLLKRTPLGASFEEVEALVQREGWKNLHAYPNHGFYDQRLAPAKTVGKASIEATLGEHPWLPLGTEGAYAAWCFDEKHRLIEIIVYKEVDSL